MMGNDMTVMDAPMTGEISLAELFGFEVDKTQDIAEIIFAAKKGEKDAMGVLGEKFLKGIDVKKSIPKALYWLRESDDERAWNSIASFYEKDGDYDRAIEWYLKVVEKDGPYSYQGMNSLCLLYLLPEKLNIEEAEYYLVKSLEAMENIPDRLKEKNGYMEYQNTLLYGAAGVLGFYYSKINPERAVFWLTEDQMNRVTERTAEEQKMFAKALAESYNQLFFLPDISEELLDEAEVKDNVEIAEVFCDVWIQKQRLIGSVVSTKEGFEYYDSEFRSEDGELSFKEWAEQYDSSAYVWERRCRKLWNELHTILSTGDINEGALRELLEDETISYEMIRTLQRKAESRINELLAAELIKRV